jgi:hypothetical protein
MKESTSSREAMLDQVAAEIRDHQLDPEAVQAASERVWSRLTVELAGAAPDRRLRSCEDFQALIPAYLAGTLPEARAMLISDHTRECVSCRRALIRVRHGEDLSTFQAPITKRRRMPVAARWALAATLLIGALLIGYATTASLIADRLLTAEVDLIDGGLHLVAADGLQPLAAGDRISSHQQVRSTKGGGSMIRLADGSMIEMAERSQLALRGSRKGTHIELSHGSVIVHAAKQGSGNLFVATSDCLVAVKGTIFSVNHGFKGSRISVIEGEVEVRLAEKRSSLHPGDQITTDPKLDKVAVEEEIAWSRNSEAHIALLRELSAMTNEMVRAADSAGVRTSTRLLELCPADTVIYTAIPNLAEGLSEAHKVLETHLAKSAALRAWWEEKIDHSEMQQELDELLDRLQPYADALGDEMAAAIPAVAINQNGGPVLLATLDDPEGFISLVEGELAQLAGNSQEQLPMQIVDDPWQAEVSEAEWLLWIEGNVFAAAKDPVQLQQVARALVDWQSNPFTGTILYSRLAAAYTGGVSWLVGVDIEAVLSTAMASMPEDEQGTQAILEQIGLLDASTLVFERHREQDQSAIRAVLDFTGPRHGIADWLAEPTTLNSLELISPNASLVSAVATRDAAEMFDLVTELIDNARPGVSEQLRAFEAAHGIDLRSDLAAPLGGELAFAIDGPMVPIPSWKLIVEVYDSVTLQQTIAGAVAAVDQLMRAQGQAGLSLTETSENGRTYHTIRHNGIGLQAVYTMADGYLIAAPHRTLIDTALQYRDTGTNLATSEIFHSLVQTDRYNGFSAIAYRNLSQLAEMIPEAISSQLPAQASQLIADNSEPSLVCLYGERDRITLNGTGTLLLSPAAILGSGGLFDDDHS